MGAVLFQHNKTAYESALTMLAKKGRAAVIHPTGTGKSFIGLKLCADFPDAVGELAGGMWRHSGKYPLLYLRATYDDGSRGAHGDLSRLHSIG